MRAVPIPRAILVLDGQVQRDREEEARAGHIRVRRDVHRRVRGRPSARSRGGQGFEIPGERRPDPGVPPLQVNGQSGWLDEAHPWSRLCRQGDRQGLDLASIPRQHRRDLEREGDPVRTVRPEAATIVVGERSLDGQRGGAWRGGCRQQERERAVSEEEGDCRDREDRPGTNHESTKIRGAGIERSRRLSRGPLSFATRFRCSRRPAPGCA